MRLARGVASSGERAIRADQRSKQSRQESPNPERWLSSFSTLSLGTHFARMPGPTLPTELVREIITLAAPEPEFDFTQSDRAAGVEQSTLHALCLTSRVFNEIATPLLYRYLILPTAEVGRALVRTIQSDRWQRGEMADKVKDWTERVSFGREAGDAQKADDGFVEGVLPELGGTTLERVAVVRLNLNVTVFNHTPGLRMLSLDRVTLDHFPGPFGDLPQLTHLHLTDVSFALPQQPGPSPEASYPALTHLALKSNQELAFADTNPGLDLTGLHAATARLKLLVLGGLYKWRTRNIQAHAARMRGLRVLFLETPGRTHEHISMEPLLSSLPAGLDTLDVTGRGTGAAGLARLLGRGFAQGWRCLDGLQVLRLPDLAIKCLCSTTRIRWKWQTHFCG